MSALVKRGRYFYIQYKNRKRRPVSKTFRTGLTARRATETLQRKLDADYALGTFDPWTDDPFTYDQPAGVIEGAPETIQTALDKMIAAKREAGKSESTLETYVRHVRGLAKRVGGFDTPLDRITPRHVELFCRDRSISQATRASRYGQLRIFFRWCHKRGMLRRNPLSEIEDPPAQPKKLPKDTSFIEILRVCSAIQEDYDANKKYYRHKGLRVWMIRAIWFAWYTGLRESELSRMRFRDIERQNGRLRLPTQKNKEEDFVPLSKKALEILDEIEWGDPDDYVWGPSNGTERDVRQWGRRFARAFAKYRDMAGIGRRITPHSTRHGFATYLISRGASIAAVQRATRHKDTKTLMRYVHANVDVARAELDRVYSLW